MLVISEHSVAFQFLLFLVFGVGVSTLSLWKYLHGCFGLHFCCTSQPDSLPSHIKLDARACAWYLGESWESTLPAIRPSCEFTLLVARTASPESGNCFPAIIPRITVKAVPGHDKRKGSAVQFCLSRCCTVKIIDLIACSRF